MSTNQNILLVEGKNDLNVIAHLLKHHLGIDKVEDVVNIENKENIDKLLGGLRNEVQRSELERLGILIDADLDLQSRWQALIDRLTKIRDINVSDPPDKPNPQGTIFTSQRIDREVKVGI